MEGFLFSGVFWGLVLILLGVSVIVKSIFKIDIPIFSLIIAFIFIYIGIAIILKTPIFKAQSYKTQNTTVFSENTMTYLPGDSNKEYNVVFGRGEIDLTNVETNKIVKIEINSVFADCKVYIKKETPIRIKGSAAFANLKFPDNSTVNFGDNKFAANDFNNGYLEIEANSVFGNLEFLYK